MYQSYMCNMGIAILYFICFATMSNGILSVTVILRSQGLAHVPNLTSHVNITTLILRDNEIEQLGPLEFSKAPKLDFLDISENLLSQIDNLTFCDTVIRKLRLKENNLVRIPNLDCLNTTIECLDLASNRIGYFHEESFRLLSNLSHLGLRNNLLSEIPYNSFCRTSLVTVLLSDNFITTLPYFGCVRNSIKHVLMRGNEIRRISPETFVNVSGNNLRIYLADNHLSNVSVLAVTPGFSAKSLDLRSNNITCILSVSRGCLVTKVVGHVEFILTRFAIQSTFDVKLLNMCVTPQQVIKHYYRRHTPLFVQHMQVRKIRKDITSLAFRR